MHDIFTIGTHVRGWTRGLRGIRWHVAGLIWDHCLDHHLGLEGASGDVGVGDSQLPGYKSSASIPKFPVEGDVCIAQVLAGVMEGDGEGDRSVLDEAHVSGHDVIDLVQRDGEGYLICGECAKWFCFDKEGDEKVEAILERINLCLPPSF